MRLPPSAALHQAPEEAAGDDPHADRHGKRRDGREPHRGGAVELAEAGHRPGNTAVIATRSPAAKRPPPTTQNLSTLRWLRSRAKRALSGSRPSAVACNVAKSVEHHHLRADENGGDREDERGAVERDSADAQRTWKQRQREHRSRRGKQGARIEEQPARRESEKQLQMPPPVPPRAQMRRARAAVRRKGRRDLADPQPPPPSPSPPSRRRTPCPAM